MINLAGKQDCDKHIKQELQGAGIKVVPVEPVHTEVHYTLIGHLPGFEFRRAWYYWVVEGDVPIDIARELYVDPIGHTDVRVIGHCGCPPPDEWLGGIHIQHDWPERPNTIPSYHIDSQTGLNLFVSRVLEGRDDE